MATPSWRGCWRRLGGRHRSGCNFKLHLDLASNCCSRQGSFLPAFSILWKIPTRELTRLPFSLQNLKLKRKFTGAQKLSSYTFFNQSISTTRRITTISNPNFGLWSTKLGIRAIKKMTHNDSWPGPGQNYGERSVFTFARKVFFFLAKNLFFLCFFLKHLKYATQEVYVFWPKNLEFGPKLRFCCRTPNFCQWPVCSPWKDGPFCTLGSIFRLEFLSYGAKKSSPTRLWGHRLPVTLSQLAISKLNRGFIFCL